MSRWSAADGDEALMDGVERREEEALRTLYLRHGGVVYALAQRLTGDHQFAQEVVQDVFLRCWERAASFDRRRGTVRSWLMGIARNRTIDVLRSASHAARGREVEEPRTSLPDTGEGGSSESVALRMTVAEALTNLPELQREAITLAFYGGMTQSQVARHLGVPLGTVKTRIRDGMARLRSVMEAEDYYD
jgi:RNA polymerase sigma-70 factor (ECF subfamily)